MCQEVCRHRCRYMQNKRIGAVADKSGGLPHCMINKPVMCSVRGVQSISVVTQPAI